MNPKLKAISGKIKLPSNFNEDERLKEYFEKKHLKSNPISGTLFTVKKLK